MIITIQFPIVDLRNFCENSNSKIPIPTWPMADTGSYVRYTGKVTKINSRAISSPFSEIRRCSAEKALKFIELSRLKLRDSWVRIKCIGRYFYFDGSINGRYELCFAIESNFKLTRDDQNKVIDYVLDLKMKISGIQSNRSKSIVHLSSDLRKLYHKSTSFQAKYTKEDLSLIKVANPVVVIVLSSCEVLNNSERANDFDSIKNSDSIFHTNKSYKGIDIKIWKIIDTKLKSNSSLEMSHAILKLNSFKEGLQFLVSSLHPSKLWPKERSTESDLLQHYFNKEANLCFKLPAELKDSEIISAVYDKDIEKNSSELNFLKVEFERTINFRKQVLSKAIVIMDRLNEVQNHENTIVNNNVFNINNSKVCAGVIGSVKDSSVTGKSTVNGELNNADIDSLCEELELLKSELIKISSNSMHYEQVASIARGVENLKEKDPISASNSLSSVTDWVIEQAKNLSLKYAESFISKAISSIGS